MQWPNFYMRNGLDTTLLPPDNELKKWNLSGYWKQLPWDSAIIARYSQSKLTNNIDLTSAAWTSSLKPTSNAVSPQGNPPGVGYLFTQPYDSSSNQNLTNFSGDNKRTTANVAWNASPMAQLDTRVYYDYYKLQNDSTTVSYRQGSQGSNCANPPVTSATCFTIPALTEENGEAFFYTKNAAGFDATWAFNRNNKLLGGFDWEGVKRNWEVNNQEAPKSDDYRYWIEYKNTGGWDNLTGWLKYEFLQRRSDLVNDGNAATSVDSYYTPYSVNSFDRNKVKLWVDWTPAPMWLLGLGATWANTEYKDNLYGRTKDTNQQYDATVAWGDDRLRITGIGNWGKIEYNQTYLAGNYPPPTPNTSANYTWGTKNTQDNWLLAGLVDWAASDKLMMTASYSVPEDRRRRRLQFGQHDSRRRFPGRPARQLQHRQHDAQSLPDQGDLHLQPEMEHQRWLRLREIRLQRRPDGGLRKLLRVLPEPEHDGGRIGLLLVDGRVCEPRVHGEPCSG